MKRYQCIKNWKFAGIHIFSQGTIYTAEAKTPLFSNGASIVDNTGACVEISDVTLHEFFHELMDLNVDDQETQAYAALQPVRGCLRFIAICFAAAIAGGLFLYLALTWRS